MAERKLSGRAQAFVYYYLKYRNAARAAKEAGYISNIGAIGYGSTGHKLLQQPKVQALIKSELERIQNEVQIDTTRILQEYIKIAFASLGDVVSFDSSGVTIKASKDLAPETLEAIQEITHTRFKGEHKFTVKMHDKLKALDALAKYVKLFKGEDEEGDEPILNLIRALNESRTRIAEEKSEAVEEEEEESESGS